LIAVWFLMALMSYPDLNAIHYKGFGGFTTLEECEEKRILTENEIVKLEMQRGHTVYVETYCMEMYAFPSQFDAPRKNQKANPAEFGA
jgi:hypothetical protein